MKNSDRVYRWSFVALFVGVLAIIILRAPATVLKPSLLFDEGPKVFAYYYEHRQAAEILRFKSGYLPLIGNLIGYAAVRLPTRLVPYGFVGSAVAITAAAYCLFFARAFRRWLPSDINRALICFLLALAPVSDCLLVTMSDYSLWNLLGVLVLLVGAGPPKRRGPRVVYLFISNLLVWAHPLAIVVAPVVLWRIFKDRLNAGVYQVLFFNLVVHQVFGVAGIVTTHGLWDHGTGIPVAVGLATKIFDACRWTLGIIAATAFRAGFGPVWLAIGVRHPALLASWIAVLLAASCLIGWKVSRLRSFLLFLGYLITSVTFLSCFLRYEDVQNDPMGFINYSPRYIYLQSLAFVLLLGTLLVNGWELFQSALVRRFGWKLSGHLAAASLAILLGYYYLLNVQLGYPFVGNRITAGSYDAPDPRNGDIVRDFFASLEKLERERGGRNGIQLSALKSNDWPITIDTTSPQPVIPVQWRHRALNLALVFGLMAVCYATRRWWLAAVVSRFKGA